MSFPTKFGNCGVAWMDSALTRFEFFSQPNASGEPLPDWAAEVAAGTWAQFILKFILSHPAVTVAIPATTRVDHVRENLAAAGGHLPDRSMRERMAAFIRNL